MNDDVGRLFEVATSDVRTPRGDFESVVRGGSRRRRVRSGVALALSISVAGAALVGAANLTGPEARPVPAGPKEVMPEVSTLVPETMEGRVPFRELASSEELATARAVTVAFHAFVRRTGYRDLDYLGAGPTPEGWVVSFVHRTDEEASAEEAREQTLSLRRDELEAEVEALRKVLRRAEARLSGRGREKQTRASRPPRETLKRLRREAQERQRRIERLRLAARPQVVEVHVSRNAGRMTVARVEADPALAETYAPLVGYGERIAEIDVWGAAYYDWTLVPAGVGDVVPGARDGRLLDGSALFGVRGALPRPARRRGRRRGVDAGGPRPLPGRARLRGRARRVVGRVRRRLRQAGRGPQPPAPLHVAPPPVGVENQWWRLLLMLSPSPLPDALANLEDVVRGSA